MTGAPGAGAFCPLGAVCWPATRTPDDRDRASDHATVSVRLGTPTSRAREGLSRRTRARSAGGVAVALARRARGLPTRSAPALSGRSARVRADEPRSSDQVPDLVTPGVLRARCGRVGESPGSAELWVSRGPSGRAGAVQRADQAEASDRYGRRTSSRHGILIEQDAGELENGSGQRPDTQGKRPRRSRCVPDTTLERSARPRTTSTARPSETTAARQGHRSTRPSRSRHAGAAR